MLFMKLYAIVYHYEIKEVGETLVAFGTPRSLSDKCCSYDNVASESTYKS